MHNPKSWGILLFLTSYTRSRCIKLSLVFLLEWVMFRTLMITKTAPEIRFWRKVQKGTADQCWPWLGNKSPKGYGRFCPFPKRHVKGKKKSKSWLSHRLAWEYTNSSIPEGLECCHTCDNPGCCNPFHLYLGTHKKNMEDMVNRGRAFHPRGELHGESKLTERQVVEIRSIYRPGVVSQPRIAKLFGVSKRLIHNVIHRIAWKHVP